MTFHPGYVATRISSNLNGSTKQFGWVHAIATKYSLVFNNFHTPCSHRNLHVAGTAICYTLEISFWPVAGTTYRELAQVLR
jgi:hypothetical protein